MNFLNYETLLSVVINKGGEVSDIIDFASYVSGGK